VCIPQAIGSSRDDWRCPSKKRSPLKFGSGLTVKLRELGVNYCLAQAVVRISLEEFARAGAAHELVVLYQHPAA
jgi:hypothetical protein